MIDQEKLHKKYYKAYKYGISYGSYTRGFSDEKSLTYTEYLEQRLNRQENSGSSGGGGIAVTPFPA